MAAGVSWSQQEIAATVEEIEGTDLEGEPM